MLQCDFGSMVIDFIVASTTTIIDIIKYSPLDVVF
jgi:hypothetical protein